MKNNYGPIGTSVSQDLGAFSVLSPCRKTDTVCLSLPGWVQQSQRRQEWLLTFGRKMIWQLPCNTGSFGKIFQQPLWIMSQTSYPGRLIRYFPAFTERLYWSCRSNSRSRNWIWNYYIRKWNRERIISTILTLILYMDIGINSDKRCSFQPYAS